MVISAWTLHELYYFATPLDGPNLSAISIIVRLLAFPSGIAGNSPNFVHSMADNWSTTWPGLFY